MIIMKRMVFSLSFERTPYQCRYYIGAWTALGTECTGALGAGSCLHLRVERVGRESTLFLTNFHVGSRGGNTLFRSGEWRDDPKHSRCHVGFAHWKERRRAALPWAGGSRELAGWGLQTRH